ncbi:MAG: hypothetical protein CSB48_08705 [Proteobacteria bacterium]|nr:MAG: hypothetical protein CSB48_08705 [Pseudomonadota bacterium]
MKKKAGIDDNLSVPPDTSGKSSLAGSVGLVFLAVALSVTASFILHYQSGGNAEPVRPEDIRMLHEKITQLEARLTEQEKQIELLTKTFPSITSKVENSTGAAMQRILIQQEASIQLFLKDLKSGMYDLAHMIPGSRTWLEHYNESMNRAIQKSIKRSRRLKRMNSGEILIEPDAR